MEAKGLDLCYLDRIESIIYIYVYDLSVLCYSDNYYNIIVFSFYEMETLLAKISDMFVNNKSIENVSTF